MQDICDICFPTMIDFINHSDANCANERLVSGSLNELVEESSEFTQVQNSNVSTEENISISISESIETSVPCCNTPKLAAGSSKSNNTDYRLARRKTKSRITS